MPNVAAVKFVKQLVAVYSRFKIDDTTKEIYTQKLSKWKLTQQEWDSALDLLVESHKDENLPALGTIYEFLKFAVSKRQEADYGFMYFDLNKYSYAVRLVRRDGVWVSAKTGKFFDAPKGATKVLFVPDKQAEPEPDSIPTKEQVAFYMRVINDNLKRIGSI
jgi:hypothetical protein